MSARMLSRVRVVLRGVARVALSMWVPCACERLHRLHIAAIHLCTQGRAIRRLEPAHLLVRARAPHVCLNVGIPGGLAPLSFEPLSRPKKEQNENTLRIQHHWLVCGEYAFGSFL